MQAYFINLINYDKFANQQIVETIKNTGYTEQPVQLMAHLLAAQQVWYNRCVELPATGGSLWPDWQLDTFEGLINNSHLKWMHFLNKIDDAAFDRQIAYQNSRGQSFSNKLSDILAHLINHGTHHRAQAGQHLKLAGAELPPMDYIFYIRQLKS